MVLAGLLDCSNVCSCTLRRNGKPYNCHPQVEIDYKAECAAGDTVDCFGARLTEPSAAAANVNGTGAHPSGSTVASQ